MRQKNQLTKRLTLNRETLRYLNAVPEGAAEAWTDVSCSTCDPRRPCCP